MDAIGSGLNLDGTPELNVGEEISTVEPLHYDRRDEKSRARRTALARWRCVAPCARGVRSLGFELKNGRERQRSCEVNLAESQRVQDRSAEGDGGRSREIGLCGFSPFVEWGRNAYVPGGNGDEGERWRIGGVAVKGWVGLPRPGSERERDVMVEGLAGGVLEFGNLV
ncbi:hypothetical protein AXG93_3822s1060 [Marchantia polymorpha subsp. ruderalis]|uniref:Uncharacterized protein n=1 Tax=Marchantia polymorpha subsp. ruderalis TaxID=1480154 RepID=A0A176WLE3_MARPO|nr:hypothetical protein AXG93_3822s1060 [Marchantia polymorpha subsp. ruderalis]